MLSDTHTHITLIEPDSYENRYNILKKAFYEEDMQYIIQINLDQKELRETVKYNNEFKNRLIYSIGSHPIDISKENINVKIEELEENIKKYREYISLVGEVGLDYYHNKDYEIQKEAFIKIIEIANRYSLPIVIHSREAKEDTYEILKENSLKKGGIMHCFSYDYEYAKSFIDMGFFISFAGNITYKKNTHLREIVKKIPYNKILVETDAPYLAPVPHRGKKNYPYYVKYTASVVADLSNLSIKEFAKRLTQNIEKLLE